MNDPLIDAVRALLVDRDAPLSGLPRVFAEGASERSLPLEGAPGGVTLQANAAVRVLAFNSEDDLESDAVLVKASTKKPAPIRFAADAAWTRCDIEADATFRAEAGVFGAKGTASVGLSEYRKRARNATAMECVVDHLNAPRHAFSHADVMRLAEGDAVSLRRRGTLKAMVSLPWADVLSANAGKLTALLTTATPLTLRFEKGLTLECSVGVTDDFSVVFARIEDDRFRVAVKKALSRTRSGELAVGLDIGLGGLPSAARRGIDHIFTELTGKTYAQLEELWETTQNDSTVSQIVEILERLGLANPLDPIEALKQRADDIRDAILALAAEKIELGFLYEYDRLQRDHSVLQLNLSAEQLNAAMHESLLSLDLSPIRTLPRATIEHYLHETSLESKRAYGFTLGLRKWQIGAKDERRRKLVRRENLDRHNQLTYLGARSYKRNWLGRDDAEWSVDLKLSMPSFSKFEHARYQEFKLGLHMMWTETITRERTADLATLWGIVSEDHSLAGEARFELKLTHGACLEWLRTTANLTPVDYAGALAAAMPRSDREGLRTASEREALYAPLWRAYLEAPDEPQAFRAAAAKHLRGLGHAELGGIEAAANRADDRSFIGLLFANPSTARHIGNHLRGARELLAAVTGQQAFDSKAMSAIHARLEALWRESHHVRAAGAMMARRAAAERTLTVEDGRGAVVRG